MAKKEKILKGELRFGKVSQGRVMVNISGMDELVGNAQLTLKSDVLGEFDPIVDVADGKIEITVNVKKK